MRRVDGARADGRGSHARAHSHDARPQTLLIASGKGGVGTSIIAALTALSAATRGETVLLVDASEGGGSLHHLFGVRPTHSLWMLTDSRLAPDDVLIPIGDGVTLVAGGTSGAAVPPATDRDRRAALMRLAPVYAHYDIIIFDGGSRLDTIAAVNELVTPSVLLVTSADRLTLAANYALIKSVSARRADAPLAVVSNRHGEALAEEACGFLVGACSHFLGRSIAIVGAIPDDPCLQAAIGAGMTVREALEGSPAADAMHAVLARVIPRTPSKSSAPRPTATPSPLPFSRRWS